MPRTEDVIFAGVGLVGAYMLFRPSGERIKYGTLTGVVRDIDNGMPLAGVIVSIGWRATVTGDDGTYSISQIPLGTYSVSFTLANYNAVILSDVAILEGENFLDGLMERVAPGVDLGTLSGTVVSTTGTPIPSAEVHLNGHYTFTDMMGRYMIENITAGSYTMQVHKEGYTDYVQANVFIEVGSNTVNIVLQPVEDNGTLSGTVMDAALKTPIADAIVTCAGKSTRTDPNGQFEIAGILAGIYVVNIQHPSYQSADYNVQIRANQVTTLRANLVALTPQVGGVSGVVTEQASGLPIPGAIVVCAGQSDVTDTFGAYRIDNIAPGTYLLQASSSGYQTTSVYVIITSGQTATADIALPLIPTITGNIQGVVTDAATSNPLPLATVYCAGQTVHTDANGRYTFSNLAPGSYTVEAHKDGYNSGGLNVNVIAGQTVTANIALTAIVTTGEIRGRVRDESGTPVPDVTVTMDAIVTTTDANGAYVFLNVPAGTHTITLQKSGYESQTITVTVIAGQGLFVDTTLHPQVAPPPPPPPPPEQTGFDHAYMLYDYFSYPHAADALRDYGSDGLSAVHVESARPRFFSIACAEGISDVIFRLKTDELSLINEFKAQFSSFIADCTARGIRVWTDISCDTWWAVRDDQPDIIEREGPRLVKAVTDYNNSVPVESRVYGIWAYVDYWPWNTKEDFDAERPAINDWTRVINWYRSLKAAATGPIVWGSFLSYHELTGNRDTMLRELQMADIGYGQYCRTLDQVRNVAESCAAACERVGTPFRIALSINFLGEEYQRLRPCPDVGISSSMQDRYNCLEGAFRNLKDQVDNYFSTTYPNMYRGTVVQCYGWGPNICYPANFTYSGPCRISGSSELPPSGGGGGGGGGGTTPPPVTLNYIYGTAVDQSGAALDNHKLYLYDSSGNAAKLWNSDGTQRPDNSTWTGTGGLWEMYTDASGNCTIKICDASGAVLGQVSVYIPVGGTEISIVLGTSSGGGGGGGGGSGETIYIYGTVVDSSGQGLTGDYQVVLYDSAGVERGRVWTGTGGLWEMYTTVTGNCTLKVYLGSTLKGSKSVTLPLYDVEIRIVITP